MGDLGAPGQASRHVSEMPLQSPRQIAAIAFPNASELFTSWINALRSSDVPFASYFQKFVNKTFRTTNGRVRDILPFPCFADVGLHWTKDYASSTRAAMLAVVSLSCASLNWMGGQAWTRSTPSSPTSVQRRAANQIREKVEVLFDGLELVGRSCSPLGAFGKLTGEDSNDNFPELQSSLVDVGANCGLISPGQWLPQDALEVVRNPSVMFPHGVLGLPPRVAFKGRNHLEYVKLIVAELRSGKTRLMRDATTAANVFAVWKRSGAQRCIWDGSRISSASCAPSPPPCLANPHSLTTLEASHDRGLRASCRDGKAWFDQLRLEPELWPYMGKPKVDVTDLLTSGPLQADGLSKEELLSFFVDEGTGSSSLEPYGEATPVACCWPMGFSWSSFVAQQVLVGICEEAGYPRCRMLQDEGTLVPRDGVILSLATDDVTAFTHEGDAGASGGEGASPLEALDQAWCRHNVAPQESKSFDLRDSAEILGISFVKGRWLAPRFSTLWSLLEAGLDLLRMRHARPRALERLLGSLHWLSLLNRPSYSAFNVIYAFIRDEQNLGYQEVWPHVLSEDVHSLSLSSLWVVDLCADWHPEIIATDASHTFGF